MKIKTEFKPLTGPTNSAGFYSFSLHTIVLFSLVLQEVELLRQEKQEIDQQLRAIQGNTSMSSMQNFTVQRRSDRGYSSDVDTMRPNRGSGASTSHQANNTSNTSGGSAGMRGRGGRGGRSNNTRYHPGNNLHKTIEPTNFYNNNNNANDNSNNNSSDNKSSLDNHELPPSKTNDNNQNGNRGWRTTSFNHGKSSISSRNTAKP